MPTRTVAPIVHVMERYSLTSAGRFNIAHEQRAVIRTKDGEREARWGLLAPWRGHGGKRGPMVFSADEATIAATPMLRNARAKRRCLVLADGWFVWRSFDKKGGKKRQAYWIHGPTPVAFAGVLATHADDGVESFAIVVMNGIGADPADGGRVAPTMPTMPTMPFMPAIVDGAWLSSPELILSPMTGWRVDAVSTRVDDAARDDAACVVPLGNPAQGELF
jgi:hypothetical protein